MKSGGLLPVFILAPAVALAAPDLSMPAGAVQSAGRATTLDSYALPLDVFQGGGVPMRQVEGAVSRTAWQVEGDATTTALYTPLRDQLIGDGFTPVVECATDGCGGFDFRYAIEVLPEPDMHVDLGDFLFLCAERGTGASQEFVTLLVSRSSQRGFIQITTIGPATAPPVPVAPQTATAVSSGDGSSIGAQLETRGAVALDDLVFQTGSAQLGDGDFASLRGLAAYLAGHPAAQVTLVGHTDAEGSLAANISLSEKRAIGNGAVDPGLRGQPDAAFCRWRRLSCAEGVQSDRRWTKTESSGRGNACLDPLIAPKQPLTSSWGPFPRRPRTGNQ